MTADLERLVAAGSRFGTIYADPPWLYDNQATRAATSNHYSGMTVKQLRELPIRELAAPDAHLHMWTTNAFLFEGFTILDAWGFEFLSASVWLKPQMGLGNYWRNSHEFMLTAIRGGAQRFIDHSKMSWQDGRAIKAARGRHSAKPEQMRNMIERASPGPFLELFGRRHADRWCVWGNQIADGLAAPDARGGA
jgi:N6-adenosine-specific RNA methylase IME4